MNELLSYKDEHPFKDKRYTILEISYIIHTWQRGLAKNESVQCYKVINLRLKSIYCSNTH